MAGKLEPEIIRPELNCAKCGSCTVVCPVFRVDGRESMTARGKMHLLATDFADRPSAVFENLFSRCLLCGACEQVCPRNLPITDIVSRARSRFSTFYGRGGLQKVAARSVLARPGLLEGLVRAGISLKRIHALPAHSGLRLRLGLLEERNREPEIENRDALPAGSEISYFTGCFARHLQPSVARATKKLLYQCNYDTAVPAAQCCCGLAAWSAGKREQARSLAKKNIQAFAAVKGPVITSCASCSSHLFTYPDLFAKDDPWHERAQQFADRVQEFSSFFGRELSVAIAAADDQVKVFYHDPCHLRFSENGQTAPRNLLTAIGFKLVEPDNGPSCCGQGGLFHLGYPETSDKIFYKISSSLPGLQPDYITTTCSGCLMQYQQGMAGNQEETKVIHLAVLLVRNVLKQ
jgi:glycolate oxidase iron-sulfur subunit